MIFDTFFHLEKNDKSKMMHIEKTVNILKSLDTGIRGRNDVHFLSRELRRDWYNSRILRITCIGIDNCSRNLGDKLFAASRQSLCRGSRGTKHEVGIPRGTSCCRNARAMRA